MADLMAPLVPIADVAYAAVQSARSELDSLARALAACEDEARRRMLSAYLGRVRSLLLRLLALMRWAREHGGFAADCAADVEHLDAQHAGLRRTADELFFTLMGAPHQGREGIWKACAPRYDVLAALDVLGGGTYSQLPRALDEAAGLSAPSAEQQVSSLTALRNTFRLRRAVWRLPEGMLVDDRRGYVLCTVPGEYEAALWATPPADGPWRIHRLRLLVGEARRIDDGDVVAQAYAVARGGAAGGGAVVGGRKWERAMQRARKAAEQGEEDELMLRVHAALHDACCELALGAMHTQTVALARGSQSAAPQLTAQLEPADEERPACLRLQYAWSAHDDTAPVPAAAADAAPPLLRSDPRFLAAPPRSACIILRAAQGCGLSVTHEPPLPPAAEPAVASGGECGLVGGGGRSALSTISMADLGVESLLRAALRARSCDALRRLAASLPAAIGASVEEGEPLPTLRTASSAVRVAVQPSTGALAAHEYTPQGQDRANLAVAPLGTDEPCGAAAARFEPFLCVAPLLPVIEQWAVALGTVASLPPPLDESSAVRASGEGCAQWAPLARRGASARWLSLPAPGAWAMEVRLTHIPLGERAGVPGATRCEYWLLQLQEPAAPPAGAAPAPAAPRAAVVSAVSLGSADLELGAGSAESCAAVGDGASLLDELPLRFSRATMLARTECLRAGAAEAGVACEVLPGGASLRLALPPAADWQPLLAGCHSDDDLPCAPLLLQVDEEGWLATAPLLPSPRGARFVGPTCTGGRVRFGSRGADFECVASAHFLGWLGGVGQETAAPPHRIRARF